MFDVYNQVPVEIFVKYDDDCTTAGLVSSEGELEIARFQLFLIYKVKLRHKVGT